MTKKLKIILASCTAAIIVLATAITVPLVIGGSTFTMDVAPRSFIFHSEETQLPLPIIRGSIDEYDIEWQLVTENGSSADIENNEGIFARISDDGLGFHIFPMARDVSSATLGFRANVIVNEVVHSTFNHTVTVHHPRSEIFNGLFSPNQSGRAAYRTQGLARERLFGLWNIRYNTTTNHWGNRDWTAATANKFLPNQIRGYVKSTDIMELDWRYNGDVVLHVQLLDENNVVIETIRNEQATYSSDSRVTIRTIMTGEEITAVNVDFKLPGVRTVRVLGWCAESDDPDNDLPRATYQYTYDIRDAVNVYTIKDVKEIEFHARVEYIINGTDPSDLKDTVTGDPITTTDPRFGNILTDTRYNNSSSLSHMRVNFSTEQQAFNYFVPRPTEELNSNRFKIFTFRNPAGTKNSQTFDEFHRWAPSFKYKDIVIRNNMQTLEEGTWFFGSVYGNGFSIDATPYSENTFEHNLTGGRLPVNGAYKNVFGTGWSSYGFENLPFRTGYGWGEVYAFYACANNTKIDNITLIGWDRKNVDGTPVRLSDYNTIGVIGTACMGGGIYDFQNGITSRSDDGVQGIYKPGLYIEGITFQNSILEKGLIIIGVNYTPNYEDPVRIDTCVLRYAGFTAIFGRGLWDSNKNTDNHEKGWAIRRNNIIGQVPEMVENEQTFVNGRHPSVAGNGRRFSNHAVIRNVTIYEISTVPIVMDDTPGGTFVRFEGLHNNFLTWLRMTDLVFPLFKIPFGCFSESLFVPGITGIAQSLVQVAVANNPEAVVYESTTFWVNLPILAVTSGINHSGWDFGTSNMNLPESYNDTIIVSVAVSGNALNLLFTVQAPNDLGAVVQVDEQQNYFLQPGALARLISSMDINVSDIAD